MARASGRAEPGTKAERAASGLGGSDPQGKPPLALAPVVAICAVPLCPPAATLAGLFAVVRARDRRNRDVGWVAVGLSVLGYLLHLGAHLAVEELKASGS